MAKRKTVVRAKRVAHVKRPRRKIYARESFDPGRKIDARWAFERQITPAKAFSIFGSPHAVAIELGVKHPSVYAWRKLGNRFIPHLSEIKLRALRPDVDWAKVKP